MEVEFAGDQEDDSLDGGQAPEAARSALGGLERAVDGFDEFIGLARLCPGHDAIEVSARCSMRRVLSIAALACPTM